MSYRDPTKDLALPHDWDWKRLKFLSALPIANGLGVAGDNDNPEWPRYIRITDIEDSRRLRNDTFRSVPKELAAEAPVHVGDILLASVGATYGKSYLHSANIGPCCYAGFLSRYRPKPEVEPSFVSYWTESAHYWDQVRANVIQATIQNFSAARYRELVAPEPTLAEQRRIVAYLDEQTVKIDRLMDMRQQQMALLKEQRAALIQQAVTRGLNPNAPMKDSGLPWLGEVPVHWEVMPMKRVLHSIIDTEHKTAPSVEGGRYLVARTTNIKQGRLVLDGAYYTDEKSYQEWTRRGIPSDGDILFTREAPAGEACIVPNDTKLCVGQRVVLLRVNHRRILPEFLLHSLYVGVAARFIQVMSQGSTVAHLNMGDIPMIPVLLPGIIEQRAIVDFVQSETEQIDNLLSAYARQLSLLAEYRAALIHECVTGQRAVPEATTA